MDKFGRFQNLWLGIALIAAAVTLIKLKNWFFSDVGLISLMVVGLALAYWRFKVMRRQETPETRGDIKTLQAIDIQRFKPWLYKNLIGQEKSVQTILQLLKRNIDMLNPHRHLGSFMLVGPTGTGKTFFAQLLAEGLYGKGALLTIPMNQEGLKGDKVVENLLSNLKNNPNRVVLLDEIDKAPENVRATFYNFLESGQLMDPVTMEWFHCPGLVIIATTNAGTSDERAALEAAKIDYGLLEYIAANSNMEKAFLARFEGLLWFGKLSPMETAQISILHLRSYYRQNGVEVTFLCPEVIAAIVKENQRFKEFGVRQLIQVVRRKSDPLISMAKNKGHRSVEIISDGKGDFLLQIKRQKKAA